MASVIRLQQSLARRLYATLGARRISTSKKNSDTASIEAHAKAADPEKNWVSYGFDTSSKAEDRRNMHSIFFASVTVCLVFGSFFLAYAPDHNLRDWAQREAFLELRRREKNGLPAVDPNLVDPGKITLPSDEDLVGQEIIV